MTDTTPPTALPASPDGRPPREPSEVDRIATGYVHRYVELDPATATALGIPGHDDRLADQSPAWHDALAALDRETLEKLRGAEVRDETDRATVEGMEQALGLAIESHEAGDHLRDLNVISCPLQAIREVFDLAPTATLADVQNIAARLAQVPTALAGYAQTLAHGKARDLVPAARQVRACAQQAQALADPEDTFFLDFVAGLRPQGGDPSPALAQELRHNAAAAARAYGEFARFLREELAPVAPEQDPVGRERYQRASRAFLGAAVDLEETYRWGLGQLERIDREQRAAIAEIFGEELEVTEAFARLDADPERQLHGTDALVEWMEGVKDEAIEALDGTMMDFPPLLRRLECKIAPTNSGGIYYTPPSLDFSRPGRMWWAVPEGVETFSTWQERTTVYHEGVPGHHLQIGYATLMADQLNLWRSSMSWTSGHGEGWALYSERLMDRLGFLPDPADRLGMLDAQRLRAARVALDIGVHLGLEFPKEWIPEDPATLDGETPTFETWDAPSAWAFLRANVAMEEKALRFELDRYLGWAGQAPSYLVGQRLWENMRDEYLERRLHDAANAPDERRSAAERQFHTDALAVGSLGLDVLAGVLRRMA